MKIYIYSIGISVIVFAILYVLKIAKFDGLSFVLYFIYPAYITYLHERIKELSRKKQRR